MPDNLDDDDSVSSADDSICQALRAMFLATAFIPGNLAGHDVASYVDIELAVADL